MKTELGSLENRVSRHLHVVVGKRYRITAQAEAVRNAHCLCSVATASRRVGGVVTEIVVSHQWNIVTMKLDEPVMYADGSGHDHAAFSAEMLEECP